MRSAALLVVLLSFAWSSSAHAQAYSWVDEKGVVHFSDTRPEGAKGKAVQAREVPASMDGSSSDKLKQKDPLEEPEGKIWLSATPSRIFMPEKIVLNLLHADQSFKIGDQCDAKHIYTIAAAVEWSQANDYTGLFHALLINFGFETPDKAAALAFAGEGEKMPDLSVIGEILSLSVAPCNRVRDLEVKWRIFDNLRRRVVYEAVTKGSDDRPQGRDETEAARNRRTTTAFGMSYSMKAAFAEASKELLRLPAFIKIATPGSQDEQEKSAGPLALRIRYGTGQRKFHDEAENLKAATATVRTRGGHGSGLLLSGEGHVLTNNHVVGSEGDVLVVLSGRELPAKVVRKDPVRDVALLQISGLAGVAPLMLSHTSPVEGDSLYVIGTPIFESLSHTVTRGVLSATREMNDLRFYQTDASVNPGNSGGPVFNEFGEVVGLVVSGLRTAQGASVDVNYVIPIEDALRALNVKDAQ